MGSETERFLSKKEVFEIMGTYYGNAHYRDAQRLAWSEHDLRLIKELLDTVNSFGYHFSNLGRLQDHEDVRFVPVILQYFGQFDERQLNRGLIGDLCFRRYHGCTPALLSLYENENDPDMRFTISNSLFLVRNKRYIPEYLSIVTGSEYGEQYDMIIGILCRFRVEAALPVLISLYEQNPKEWTFAFLTLGKLFRNPIIVPYLRELQNHPDGEFRSMAKKALRFLGCLQEAAESAPNDTSLS